MSCIFYLLVSILCTQFYSYSFVGKYASDTEGDNSEVYLVIPKGAESFIFVKNEIFRQLEFREQNDKYDLYSDFLFNVMNNPDFTLLENWHSIRVTSFYKMPIRKQNRILKNSLYIDDNNHIRFKKNYSTRKKFGIIKLMFDRGYFVGKMDYQAYWFFYDTLAPKIDPPPSDSLTLSIYGTKLREIRTVSGATTTLDWCGDVVLEQVGSGTKIAKRLRTEEGYVDLTVGTGATAQRYFVRDHLGSVRAVVNVSGTSLETDDYSPLGGPLPTGTSTTLQPEKYQGKEWNPSASFNVYDFGARLYDPTLGRWLSQDPMAEKYYLHSPYLFCAGNPMRFVDPTGEKIVVRHTSENNTFSEYEWQEQNNAWGFYDAEGNLFDGTDNYIQNVSSALLTLMKGETGNSMIKEIAGHQEKIMIVAGNHNQYYPTSKTIGWSPNNNNSFPFISLGHELAHSLDDLRGTINTATWIPASDHNGYLIPHDITYGEVFATHYENLIRTEHGLPLRTGYLKSQGNNMYVGPKIVDRRGQSIYFNKEGLTTYKPVNKNNRYRY